MAKNGINDDDLKFLSPEERAGIEDNDGMEPEAVASSDPDPAVRSEVKEPAKVEAKAEEVVETAAAEPAAEQTAPEVTVAADGRTRTVAVEIPEGEAENWDALRKAALEQYEAGDVSREQYDRQIVDLTMRRAKHEFAITANKAAQEAAWKASQDAFWKQHKDLAAKPGMRAALDAYIQRIDDETGGTLDGYDLLVKAKEALDAEFGPPVKADPPKPKESAAKQAVAAQAKALDKAPQTLADVPVADRDTEAEDKFAHLDRLTGMDYELALARMSKSDQEAYARA